jgi:predicted dehydrogenase
MTTHQVRLALVGLGGVARGHLAAYRALPQVTIVAGVDPDPGRRAWAEQQYGIRTFASLDAAVAAGEIDLACDLTPASLHRQTTVALLEHGIHVLCEKPLAITLADALAMNSAAQRHHRRLFFGATYRWMPALRKSRELIRQGAIGAPRLLMEQMVGGRGARDRIPPLSPIHYPVGGPGGGGMGLVDHGVHLLDAFSWLLDEPTSWVFGQGEISGGHATVEAVQIGYGSGALGLLTYFDSTFSARLPNEGSFCGGAEWGIDGTYFSPGQWNNSPGEVVVHGEDGALRIRHYSNQIFHFHGDGFASIPVGGEPPPAHFARQLQSVLSDIASPGSDEAAPAEVGIDALRVLLAIYASARLRRAVSPGEIQAEE